jgi:23S rRNA (cytidine1920-2'-O)/16S rRNA (cytidine1409-2'-O)-methyltransferase
LRRGAKLEAALRAVVDLERTNLADLGAELVPETIGAVTADLSYISLARAVPQPNGRIELAPDADLLAVVKPQFELGLPAPPTDLRRLAEAVDRASAGVDRAGWTVTATVESPARGRRGATELLLHARRRLD